MKIQMKDTSIDILIQRVRDAVYRKLNPNAGQAYPVSMPESEYWVQDVFVDYVIARKNNEYYKISYTFDGAGDIILGEITPVEQQWVAKEHKSVRFKRGNIKGLGKHLAKKYGPADEGFFTRCMAASELSEYDEETRKSICARAHKEQIGHWPGEKKKECAGCKRTIRIRRLR